MVKTGAGATLLKTPEILLEIGQSMVSLVGEKKVGIKLHSGWNHNNKIHLELAKDLEKLRVGWISVHPRSVKQGFSGKADWDQLKELQQQVNIPVIGSGDLYNAENVYSCLRKAKIKGTMLARGALRNPAISQSVKDLVTSHTQTNYPFFKSEIDNFELEKIMFKHVQLCGKMTIVLKPFLGFERS